MNALNVPVIDARMRELRRKSFNEMKGIVKRFSIKSIPLTFVDISARVALVPISNVALPSLDYFGQDNVLIQ